MNSWWSCRAVSVVLSLQSQFTLYILTQHSTYKRPVTCAALKNVTFRFFFFTKRFGALFILW